MGVDAPKEHAHEPGCGHDHGDSITQVKGFAHLHLHTQYSLLDGANKISRLMPTLKKLGLKSVAMTDHGNMFGAVDFYKAARKEDIKPIIGCEVYVAPRSRLERAAVAAADFERAGNNHLILLAMNQTGYANLSRLVSQSYKDGFYYKPRIDKELLQEWNEGLICLSGCLAGEVATAIGADRLDKARESIEWFSRLFGDRYYLEIQDNHLAEQRKVNEVLIPWSKEMGIPLVATNDCHYLEHSDSVAHEVLLCVQTGKRLVDEDRWKFGTDQLFVKGYDDMLAAFPHAPQCVDETVRLAERCNLDMRFGNNKFPVYQVPKERTLDDVLAEDARRGLDERLATARATGRVLDEDAYRERLESEITMIQAMKFAGYFLIVADFINWAKEQGIPVGPGRGSAAGSLVSYAMRITDIDPIPYNLLFERFLNPERISMPDIDVDFCYERREEVLDYVRKKYGEDRVAHIITFGTLKGKAALRDVGRVLDFSFGETDRICKLYPASKQGRDVPLEEALAMEPKLRELRDSGEREAKLFEYAMKLEGLARHVSKHAAGIVISDRPLVEDVPLFVDKDGTVITQFSGPDVEAIGLIKFDFLGLKTLTLIADAVRRAETTMGGRIDITTLPLDDPAPYRLITRGDTVGIFQLESGGMRKLLTRMKPSCFEDLIAALALYRPGPLDSGMVEEYIQRKSGRAVVKYPDPCLEPILKDTHGVIVYQEQVMQIAQVYAGYTLGQADMLRRVMGKKKLEEMQKERKIFLERAAAVGRDEATATGIFEQMETFAAYGFNKSHSAAYAMVTYQTAWLKAHYPKEFLAALLTLEMGSTDSTYKNLADSREHGVRVLPPDVNESHEGFTVISSGIRFGLGAVKGIGQKAVELITQARESGGEFKTLGDFCLRADGSQITRRIIESLIKAGAMASIDQSRARLLAGIDAAAAWAERVREDRSVGQIGLFGGGGGGGQSQPEPALPIVAEFDALEVLGYEHDSVGFFISGHPLDRYPYDLDLLRATPASEIAAQRDGANVRVAGVTNTIRRKNSKKGERYATFNIEDREGVVEVIAWPDCYRRCETAIIGREPVVVLGRLEFGESAGGAVEVGDEEGGPDYSRKAQIIADDVIPLPQARCKAAQEIHLRIDAARVPVSAMDSLSSALRRYPGKCRAYLHIVRAGVAETEIELPVELSVDPNDGFLQAAVGLLGDGSITLRGVLEEPQREQRWKDRRAS